MTLVPAMNVEKLGLKLLTGTSNAVVKGVGLTDDIAKTFQFGKYTEMTLDKPIILSRYYDNVSAFAKGRFMINSTSGITFLDRMGLALKSSWNGMTKVAHWEIPVGSTICPRIGNHQASN